MLRKKDIAQVEPEVAIKIPTQLTATVNQNVDVALEYFTKNIADKTNDMWVQTLIPDLQQKGVTKQISSIITTEGIPTNFRG